MHRRTFVGSVAGGFLLAAVQSVFGQSAAAYRIGYISPESESSGRPTFDAFRGGLRDLGYVEGQNVIIDARWGDGSDERLDQYAAELIQSGPNVIVAQTRAVFSARQAGATMPVVFGFSGDRYWQSWWSASRGQGEISPACPCSR